VFIKAVNYSPYHKSLAQLCHQELIEQLQHFKLWCFTQGCFTQGFYRAAWVRVGYARSIHQNACFRPRMCLLGVSTIPPTFRRSTPPHKKLQPNQQSSKIAIYQSLMKISASNFTDRLITGYFIK